MKSVQHTASFDIAQPLEELFPLFSPEGEKLWVPNWDYENVMGTTELSEDYIFLTRDHDHAATHAIWLVKRYLPEEGFVQYYRVEPEDKVGVVTIQCSPKGTRMTKVEVTYRYIPLSERGRDFVDGFSPQIYEDFIDEWRQLLLRYFETQQ